jgi:small subunit ribosomal protein S1
MDQFEVGKIVSGTITKVEEKHALVDIGFEMDAILPISEISSFHLEKATEKVSEGDNLEVEIKKMEEEEIVVSLKAVAASKAWGDLERKFASQESFDVIVKEQVKGGLLADVGVRAFIPASLFANHFVEDFSEYVGQTITVKIAELEKDKNKVILSRRAVLDDEKKAKKKEAFSNISEGQVVEGTVQRIADFGVFINLGGIDGLVHISQLSHERVDHPSKVVSEGEKVKVKVLGVDLDNERISLSIKDTLPGPWEHAKGDLAEGEILEGKVTRVVSFGAFVEIKPGIEGLVHISQLSQDRVNKAEDVVKTGQTVTVKVMEVDFDKKRISLSIRAVEEGKERAEMEKYVKEYKQDETQGFSLGDRIGDQLNKLRKL